MAYTGSCLNKRSFPRTLMWSSAGSALVPNSLTTRPLTVTSPSRMSCSAARREAIPARAISFCRRSLDMEWATSGAEAQRRGEDVRGFCHMLTRTVNERLEPVAEKVHPLRARSSEILTYDPVRSGFLLAAALRLELFEQPASLCGFSSTLVVRSLVKGPSTRCRVRTGGQGGRRGRW